MEHEEDIVEEKLEQLPEERRGEERAKSRVKRTILANLTDPTYGSMANHLYLVDISSNGLRINLDRTVEPETELSIKFCLNALGHGLEGEFEATCRVVWSKPLAGGTCILGMEFVELPEEHRATVETLIEQWKEKGLLEFETLPTPVDAKIRTLAEEPEQYSVSVRAISRQGFRFPTRAAWQVGQELNSRLLLEPGTVDTPAVVRWCEEMPNGAREVGCEFKELTAGQESYIDLHLKRCRHRPIV